MAREVVFSRRSFLASLAMLSAMREAWAEPAHPTFMVLSLFRPRQLVVHAESEACPLQFDQEAWLLQPGSQLILDSVNGVGAGRITARGVQGNCLTMRAGNFAVEVPGKLRRTYRGSLAIRSNGAHLRCVIGIERETAVASIAAAESPPGAGLQALAAQAVAARSFLAAARTAHTEAQFCDTTHCQFLREPPPATSAHVRAAALTEGVVLQYRDRDAAPRTLAAMYCRSCGHRTRTLAELGLSSRGYPYYAVDCAFCTAHPEAWQRAIDGGARGEQDRLAYNRVHGWSALPGHADSATSEVLSGRGVGHGLGLCQLGAAAMAARGAGYAEILAHYYPNTTLAHMG